MDNNNKVKSKFDKNFLKDIDWISLPKTFKYFLILILVVALLYLIAFSADLIMGLILS